MLKFSSTARLAEEKKLRRKLDLYILPQVTLLYRKYYGQAKVYDVC